MIRGIRSSVSSHFLLFLKADWEILFHMQTEGGRLSTKLKLGSWSCLYRAEDTFFTAVALLRNINYANQPKPLRHP